MTKSDKAGFYVRFRSAMSLHPTANMGAKLPMIRL
jgi:hypothetical protein